MRLDVKYKWTHWPKGRGKLQLPEEIGFGLGQVMKSVNFLKNLFLEETSDYNVSTGSYTTNSIRIFNRTYLAMIAHFTSIFLLKHGFV